MKGRSGFIDSIGNTPLIRLRAARAALPVLFDLVEHEDLVLGGWSGISIVGAMRLARELGPGKTIVTILADGGQRYQSNLFNPDFLRKNQPVPPWMK
jgi:cysteine synthase A